VRLFWHGEEAGAIPVEPISTEAPVYRRPMERPSYLDRVGRSASRERGTDADLTGTLSRLLASPNLCSKRWIYEQYDMTVRTNTFARPEQSDAAIVRVKGTGRALAMSSDVNPVYCFLDPYEGGKQAVAEAARNIACSGAEPVAITDCLNFGSPERPEIMWQFAECIRGLSDACTALETPVVSGNVSFYNETEGRAIYPTPTVGMVGILENDAEFLPLHFRRAGEAIVLFGTTQDELGGSEWIQMTAPEDLCSPPRVDLDAEARLIRLLLDLRLRRLTHSAHDVSNGGLAVALAESSMNGVGCRVDLRGHADGLDAVSLLFSESQGRAFVTCAQDRVEEVLRAAKDGGVPATRIGETREAVFTVARGDIALITSTTPELHRIWSEAFPKLLSGDTIEDVIRGTGKVEDVIAR
jgi:phosphoribosylformylglycinamidine synthase